MQNPPRASTSKRQSERKSDDELSSSEDDSEEESEESGDETESPEPRRVTAASKAKKESSIFAGADEEFFTEHAQDQRFLALKQASKLDYYRKENEQLKEQIKNLSTNLQLNKQILALTEQNTATDRGLNSSAAQPDPALKVQARLQAYHEREETMQKQIDELLKQRENDQAQILIFEQMLADFKQQENDQVKDLEDQIEELKAKLDKTEYIIQYKEKIWTYLEREIRKVVSEDSDLMKKVKAQTKILTDCLATTKVSNVVKQNDNLLNDHTRGCEKLQKINETLKKDLIETEIIVSPSQSTANK